MSASQVKTSLVLLVVSVYLLQLADGAVTTEQMAQARGLIRQSCLGKSKITNDIADGIAKGKASDDKNTKCYIHCVFEMTNAMKRSKITLDGFFKQVDTLMPEEMRPSTKEMFSKCKDAATGIKEPCEAGFALYKCLLVTAGSDFDFA